VARERWRRAIEQQIMLQRMEKQNQTIIKASTEADTKRLKLCYKDPSIHVDNISRKWAELLSRPLPLEQSELRPILLEGVTPARRGEVWSLLIQLYQDTHPCIPPSPPAPPSPLSFTELCQESTEYENAIRMDLGRTFPSHPYFSTVEGRGGQEALANMLHAYAVSDKDIGYCQGLSFVAGMILMHTKDEESAYKLLCHLMHVYGYRDVYSPDLSVLQLRLYQLSRLLHDVLPTLHSHLGSYDITPFYYAAPWFLTLFSSQYPIAFVARVMDLFFLEGPDIVFKVAVALLRFYETRILRCTTMESISEFLKERMPQLVLNHMITILNDALHMDLESKLQSFETEYFVLEELTTSFSVESEVQDLKSLNESFRSHNKELIEQLAFCRGMISNLEATVTILQETVRQQQLRLDR
jgi:TBC1 domain-containing protein 4